MRTMTTLKEATAEIDEVTGRLTLAELRVVPRALALVRDLSKASTPAMVDVCTREAKEIAALAGWDE